MPMGLEEMRLPSGRSLLRVEVYERITPDDARAYLGALAPGGEAAGRGVMVVVGAGIDVPRESRTVLCSVQAKALQNVALVIASAPMRVVTSFVLQQVGHAGLRVFSAEREAVAHLDAALAPG